LDFELVGDKDGSSRCKENFDMSGRGLRGDDSPRQNRLVCRRGGQRPWLRRIKVRCDQPRIGEQCDEAGREEPTIPDFGSLGVLAKGELGKVALEIIASDYGIFIHHDQAFVFRPAKSPDLAFVPLAIRKGVVLYWGGWRNLDGVN
jgi:hypothetical protein